MQPAAAATRGLAGASAEDSPSPPAATQEVEAGEPRTTASAARGASDGGRSSSAAVRDGAASVPAEERGGPEAGDEGAKTGEGRTTAPAVRGEGPGRLWARVAAAIAGGVLLYLAFPPLDLWFLAPPGVALAALSVYGTRPRRGAWLGFLNGLGFLVPAMAWVQPIGFDAWLALAAMESGFYAALGAATAFVMRLPLWPLWTAALWVTGEWARSLFPFGGFPWARVAFSQAGSPFTPYAALGGAPLTTFAVALCGALIAAACVKGVTALRRVTAARSAAPAQSAAGLEGTDGGGSGGLEATDAGGSGSGRDRSGTRSAGRPAARWRPVALLLAGAVAVPVLAYAVPRPGDEGRTVTIAAIQGNVPGRGMNPMGDERAVVLRNHANKTHELAAAVRAGRFPKPDLVVWPENSSDIDPYRDASARAVIDAAVKDVGVPVLVGVVVAIGDEHRATRSLVWDPVTGPGDYYDKQQLVPFGEFTPMQELVQTLFARARLVGRQSIAGTEPGDLRMGPATIGAVNCYEIAFDPVVRETVKAGSSPIVVQANNATYALSDLPVQQLAMYRLRAVEHNRAVVAAATTGVSAFVEPDGRVSWRTGELVADMNARTVQVRTEATLATRVGPAPEWVLVAVAISALAWAASRRPRSVGAPSDHEANGVG
ncbi:apolipoprotein N-acyltransferase [Sinosporangium siamense]|uniref:Apolipoprotein N-acyltransferase n=1 Tax=Sinosporangium siamense TaxID=1367973 RepID=A0A919V6D5_9ACTN|nr:apolipoprotein N-acyltransferase [Sinosporangium siamense]GII93945.1 apolipoprotein N-acyltransferase [Sinosporangium siamense]